MNDEKQLFPGTVCETVRPDIFRSRYMNEPCMVEIASEDLDIFKIHCKD